MKMMKQWMLCLLVAPLIFSSCQRSVSPQLGAIPKDAMFVVAVDNKQLIEKGGFNKLNDFKFYEEMLSSLAGDMDKNWLLSIMNDHKKSGLDIDQAYFFMEMQDKAPRFVFVTGMKNQALFEQNLLQANESSVFEIEDKLSHKMLAYDEALYLVWNDELFFAFAGELESPDFERYFKLPAEESLMSLADFRNFSKRSSDLALWCPMQAYIDLHTRFALSTDIMSRSILDDWTGVNVHGYLDFKNDEIKLDIFMTPKEKVDAYFEKYPILKKDPNQDILKDLPATSYLAFKMAMDFPLYIKLLKQTMSEAFDRNYPLEQIVDALEDPTVHTIFNALAGDIGFSLYGFSEGLVPLMGLSFTVNSEADFQKLLALLPEGMLHDNGDYYELSLGFMMSVHIACKNNRVFITDDEKSITAFLSGGHSRDITSHATIGRAMKTSPLLFYINLNISDYPKSVRDLMAGSMGIGQRTIATLDIFEDFSVYMNSKYHSQASLKFKSGKENSLKQLVKLIDNLD
jgi:hypothetical protein